MVKTRHDGRQASCWWLAAPLLLLCTVAPAAAYEGGPPPTCNLSLCNGSEDNCFEGCTNPATGGLTVCGYWLSDYDGDGVSYPTDNCLCKPNPNQEDCDSDNRGDICDWDNSNWILVEDVGRCTLQAAPIFSGGSQVGWNFLQIGAAKFQNTCGNTTCVEHYVVDNQDCYESPNFSLCCADTYWAYPPQWCSTASTCPTGQFCPF